MSNAWETLKESFNQNLEASIPKAQKQAKKKWMTYDVIELIKGRKNGNNQCVKRLTNKIR